MPAPVAAVRPPTLDEINDAASRLADVVVRTPLVPLHSYEQDSTIKLKLEILQPVGSFKIRGVFNAVAALGADVRKRGISTVSAGNTAKALAWSGQRFGVPARSLMPKDAPSAKIEAVRAYGGEPILVETQEMFRFLKERAWEAEPYAFIHPWTNRNLMIGHGTMAVEIIQDCPSLYAERRYPERVKNVHRL